MHGDDASCYFLARPRESESADFDAAPPGEEAAHKALCTRPDTNYIELWHKHGVEKDAGVVYDSGNNEPKRGASRVCHCRFLVLTPAAVQDLSKIATLQCASVTWHAT